MILVEDVITSGKSIIETIDTLEKHKLKVVYVIVLLNRLEDGIINVKKQCF